MNVAVALIGGGWVDAWVAAVWRASLTSIQPGRQARSQTATVRVQFDSPPADLRPGNHVKVRFLRDKPKD